MERNTSPQSTDSSMDSRKPEDNNSDGSLIENGGTTPQQTGKVKFDTRFVMTMIGLSMAFTVAEVIPLFLASSFTVIAVDLDAVENLVWIVITPYISTGAIAPIVGSLTDILGRKWMLVASLGLTCIAAAIQGAAPYFTAFLVGQVISGFGIGIQLLSVASAASELVPASKRGLTYAFLAAGFLPMAPASLYGQLMVTVSWRWVYLVVGIWSIIAAVILSIWYNAPSPTQKAHLGDTMQILARLDWIGCALSTTGLVLFLVGLNSGGNLFAWDSAFVISFLVIGAVLMLSFVGWEVWLEFGQSKYFAYKPIPMVPGALLQYKRHFIAVAVLAVTAGVNYLPLSFFWTIEVFTVYQADYFQAGIYLLPLGFCEIGGAVIAAALITIFPKRIQWVLSIFCVMQIVGIATMAAIDPDDINTAWPSIVFGLIGVGAVLLPSQIIFTLISPDEYLGTMVALSVALRMLGQVVGKSMFYSIFESRVQENALTTFVPAAYEVGIRSPEEIGELLSILPGGPLSAYISEFPQINTTAKYDLIVKAGQDTYFPAFPLLDYVSIAWGGAALISSLCLYGIDKFIDDRILVSM